MTKSRVKAQRRRFKQIYASLDQLSVKDALDFYDEQLVLPLQLLEDDLILRLALQRRNASMEQLRRVP